MADRHSVNDGKSTISKQSSLRRANSRPEQLSLNQIICLMTNNQVTQMQAQIFIQQKFGQERIQWMKMSNEDLGKLASQAKQFKRKQANFISNKLFLRELKENQKNFGDKLRNGNLMDNLKTSIVSYQLMLDQTVIPQHRKAILNAVNSLKHQLSILQSKPSPSHPKKSVQKMSIQKKLMKIFKLYSKQQFIRAKNILFDQHKSFGLPLQHFTLFLKDSRLLNKAFARQQIIKLFMKHSKNRSQLSSSQFISAIQQLKTLYTKQRVENNQFQQAEEPLMTSQQFQGTIQDAYKKIFVVSSANRKARSLAPHSGRLQNQLVDQLSFKRKIKIVEDLKKIQKPAAVKLPLISGSRKSLPPQPSKSSRVLLDPDERDQLISKLVGGQRDQLLDKSERLVSKLSIAQASLRRFQK